MTFRTTVLVALATTGMLLTGCAQPEPDLAPAPVRTSYEVQRDDASIRVIAEGEGPTVVLLPSRGRDSLDFDTVAAGIAADGYRVLRPQPRGVAGSTGPLEGITLHDLAADVADVVRHAGTGPAVIVGHAYGNWVARMTAVDHPDLVRGVVIAAAAAADYPPELSVRVTRSSDMMRPEPQRREDLRAAFFAEGNDPSPWLHGWYPDASRAQRTAGTAIDRNAWWSGGTVPMLDLVATEDPFRPAGTENEIRDEFGDRVTVQVVPGASHALLPERPQAVVDAIGNWIGSLPEPVA